jgi:hypothetical protein
MKPILLAGTLALVAGSLLAAEPKDDIQKAAKALGDKSNYSWKSTVEAGGGGGRFGGPTTGKTEKGGATHLVMTRGENTTEAYLQDGKGAVKLEEGWKSLAEAGEGDGGGGQFNRGRFIARLLQNYKLPDAQAADLAGKSKDLKNADGAITGTLTEAAAKELLTFGGRGGGDGPSISNPKGSVKFWLSDGQLTKYEFRVQGSVSFNGNDREVDRTTTVEIKDIGSTKVTVPEEAKKKLS